MMMDQKVLIPRLGGTQDNFLHWSAQIRAILKAKGVWHVVRADDAVSLSSWHQVQVSEEGSDVASDPEYGRDIEWSIILQGLGEVPLACVMLYQRTHGRCGSSYMSDTVRRLLSVNGLCTQRLLG